MSVRLIMNLAIPLALAAGLVASTAWPGVPVVSAHGDPVRSEPAPNSVLDQPPDRVELVH
jgi:methionine-rich copper-binding protein CopC